MTVEEYASLNFEACKVGLEDHPALKRLISYIQAEELARSHFKKYVATMHEWEQTCAKTVRNSIDQKIKELKEEEHDEGRST